MSDGQISEQLILVPRVRSPQDPMRLDMREVYMAESRLGEVARVTPATSPELMATYNEAANTLAKYLSWVKYELLSAEKEYELAKAEVILDKVPEHALKLKELGIKSSEDFRAALIAKDPKCSDLQEKINGIECVYALLEAKAESFIRAYSACKSLSYLKDQTGLGKINASPGMTLSSDGFMGQSRYTKE